MDFPPVLDDKGATAGPVCVNCSRKGPKSALLNWVMKQRTNECSKCGATCVLYYVPSWLAITIVIQSVR